MQTIIGSHVIEEMLVRYASSQIPDHALEELEEHILMCEMCQARLDAVDEYLRAGAKAAQEIRAEGRLRQRNRRWSWSFIGPKLALGFVLCTALIWLAVPSFLRRGAAPRAPTTEISLIAARGSAQTLVSRAQAGNVSLKIDTSELPILAAYRLQVVDATGHEIWAGSASGVQQQIRVAIPGPLRSGQYWIRLFGQDKTQLREFGLEVQ